MDVRGLRKRIGLTQAALASMLGVSQPMISQIESGRKKLSARLSSKLVDITSDITFITEVMPTDITAVIPTDGGRENVVAERAEPILKVPEANIAFDSITAITDYNRAYNRTGEQHIVDQIVAALGFQVFDLAELSNKTHDRDIYKIKDLSSGEREREKREESVRGERREREKEDVRVNRTRHDYGPEFAAFWDVYRPVRSVRKVDAERAYNAARKRGAKQDELLKAAENYRSICDREGREPRYRMHATTFLNSDRWRDYTDDGGAMTEQAKKTVRQNPLFAAVNERWWKDNREAWDEYMRENERIQQEIAREFEEERRMAAKLNDEDIFAN